MRIHNFLIAGALVLIVIPANSHATEPALPDLERQDLVTIELTDGTRETTYAYARHQAEPVVTLERWPGELRSDVPAETIELFGSGLLRVTYPEFRIFEGTYVLQLSQEDTHALLSDLADCGVPESDGREWKRQSEIAEREAFDQASRRGVTEIVGHRTSDTLTVIHTRYFKTDTQAGTQAALPQDATAQTFRYYGLATDAGRHRELEALAVAANVEKRLLELADQARAESDEDL